LIVLGLDTCLEACAAAVLDGERVRAVAREPMARGHQERLAPLAQQVMAEAGLAFSELERVGVTVGPGSFTGLRVGLAFAKGLAAALGRPLAGVGVLEALAAQSPAGLTLAVLDARRGQVYLQPFRDGAALAGPAALAVDDALALAGRLAAGGPATLIGSGAALLASAVADARVTPADSADPVLVARLAAAREPAPVQPLYLRAPDARLPAA
jgi:tRNA threonylcarbamoyladenosine biosynthesis protein TsaB